MSALSILLGRVNGAAIRVLFEEDPPNDDPLRPEVCVLDGFRIFLLYTQLEALEAIMASWKIAVFISFCLKWLKGLH